MADDIKVSADPASTYGATDAYKEAWHAKYGNLTPAASASKSDWTSFATAKGGMTDEQAESMTRDELVAHFGGGGIVYSAPAAPNDKAAGGAGTGPEGNVASDPMRTTASTTTSSTSTSGSGTSVS